MILAVVFRPASAHAHKPLEIGHSSEALKVPDLSTSFVAYKELQSGEQVDSYEFDGHKNEKFHASLSIPAIGGLEQFEVMTALVGPGLPRAELATLPVEQPAAAGVRLYPNEHNPPFFEPFTMTRYWRRQQLDLELPETGEYSLVVWNPDGQTGKYVLSTGYTERFTVLDVVSLPLWWVLIHKYFEHTPYLIVGSLITMGLLTFAAYHYGSLLN
jgi:hypothetical protein